VRQPARRSPLALLDDARKNLGDMHDEGLLEKSESPWASPLVIAKHVSGEILRTCQFLLTNRDNPKSRYTTNSTERRLKAVKSLLLRGFFCAL